MKYLLDENEFNKLHDEIYYFNLLTSIREISESFVEAVCKLKETGYCDGCLLLKMEITEKHSIVKFCRHPKNISK